MDSMTPQSRPEFGRTQPDNGVSFALPWERMGRPRVPAKAKGTVEALIGQQLRAWVALAFPDRKYATYTKKIEALAKRSGVGKETIRNILQGSQSARIDNLYSIVEALGRTMTELFDSISQQQEDALRGGRVVNGDDVTPQPGSLQRS